ncbi:MULTISPECIES: hypothetical protein [Myroides]|uniref:Lipoprotein n=1 Tax=Myroides albus TaxID=2562892 RepID=A0A6I3LEK6_9FLAO|nr:MULTISPECIES: hypothetical protein [Myroides]MTG97899.1 hypothetical protein [Myroides albus]MVX36563.1 hypothetical protein [Myroides sp. LoEW2-1]UVD81087.1 hypothetical protein NWE55_07510 [Myroides albus]
MKSRLLALLLTITTFLSCDDPFKRQDFYLSNPTDKEITVSIDDKKYTLAPNTFEVLKLDSGIHQLEYNGQKNKFNVFKQNSGGIINPTLEPHYIFSMVYATEGNFDKFRSTAREVVIDDVLYQDNIKSTNALFIDNNLYRCTYFLGEEYPTEQITHNKNAVGNFFNKFFTKAEFIAFYDEDLPAENKGFHQQNKVAGGVCTITEPSVLELKLPILTQASDPNNSSLNEDLLNKADSQEIDSQEDNPYADLVASYKKEMQLVEEFKISTDTERQKEIQKELFDLSMNRTKLDINYRNLSTEQNQSMNDFVHASGRISGAGIIQL